MRKDYHILCADAARLPLRDEGDRIPMPTITLHLGQGVQWPPAPGGVAQVHELLRKRVRVTYRCKSGRYRYPLAAPRMLAAAPLLLPLDNPLGLPIVRRREKCFTL